MAAYSFLSVLERGRDFLRGQSAVLLLSLRRISARQGHREHTLTAAFMPVAYPLLHHGFSPVEFQGFPYPEVELITPQKLSDTAAVSD